MLLVYHLFSIFVNTFFYFAYTFCKKITSKDILPRGFQLIFTLPLRDCINHGAALHVAALPMCKGFPSSDLQACRPVGMAVDLRHSRFDFAALVKVNLVHADLIIFVVGLRRDHRSVAFGQRLSRQRGVALIDSLLHLCRCLLHRRGCDGHMCYRLCLSLLRALDGTGELLSLPLRDAQSLLKRLGVPCLLLGHGLRLPECLLCPCMIAVCKGSHNGKYKDAQHRYDDLLACHLRSLLSSIWPVAIYGHAVGSCEIDACHILIRPLRAVGIPECILLAPCRRGILVAEQLVHPPQTTQIISALLSALQEVTHDIMRRRAPYARIDKTARIIQRCDLLERMDIRLAVLGELL
nr:MAG TPA: hypothetical protein [Caudoviricetes sp.]